MRLRTLMILAGASGPAGTARLGSAIFVVSLDDALHQAVADDVALIEIDERDAFDLSDHIDRLDEAGAPVVRKVDLRHVAGDDRFRIETQTCEEHFHLLARGVLGLVEDDEGVVERTTAHEGERRDLDRILIEKTLEI